VVARKGEVERAHHWVRDEPDKPDHPGQDHHVECERFLPPHRAFAKPAQVGRRAVDSWLRGGHKTSCGILYQWEPPSGGRRASGTIAPRQASPGSDRRFTRSADYSTGRARHSSELAAISSRYGFGSTPAPSSPSSNSSRSTTPSSMHST